MKIGDLGKFTSDEGIYECYGCEQMMGRFFFINDIIREESAVEILMLDNGKKWIFTEYELRYFTKIFTKDKKCP